MPETDFGAKKCRRKKLEFSRLNPDFKKRWVQPAELNFWKNNRGSVG